MSAFALSVGCGSVDSTSADGGGGTGGATSTTSTDATVSTSSISSTSTTTTAAPMCGAPEPDGCVYPERLKGYYPGAQQQGAFLPAPGEDDTVASASCMDPLSEGVTITRAVVGFASDPPMFLPIDTWTQTGEDPGERVPDPKMAILESVEDGPDSLTSGVYIIDAPIAGDGLTPCIALVAEDYYPFTMAPSDECYQPARSWWYGLPKNGDGSWSWAMLDCPEDDSILSYRSEFAYELRP